MSEYNLVNQWVQYLLSKGRKELTAKDYDKKVSKCLRMLEYYGRSTDPRKLTENDLVFLNDVLEISETSRKDYLKALSRWVEWMTGADLFKKADILWNAGTECPNRIFIDKDDFAKLMQAGDERERVILMLGGCMGLRNSEIRDVRFTDIKDGRLTIHGKGHGRNGKTATMLVPPAVMSVIREWADARARIRLQDESDGRIVVAYVHGRMRPMGRSGLSHLVRELGESVGVDVTPHSLRRLFATSLYSQNVDLVDIKALMRHEDVSTTVRCYIKADTSRLDAILSKQNINISSANISNRHCEIGTETFGSWSK